MSKKFRRDQRSPEAQAYSALYKTGRWRKLRWAMLVRDRFTCRMCGRVMHDTSQLVADHIKEHKGDEALFWDEDNIQTLCKTPCHDSLKQSMERGGKKPTIGEDGWPVAWT